uniref:Uncharacterized protein n=1 Tax=Cucumis sativus TaxID=3659 RepID=A0A0A0LJD9_CUCSA
MLISPLYIFDVLSQLISIISTSFLVTLHFWLCSKISRANSLQNLNIGGTYITDISLLAIADNCPNLKTIVLWCCRLVTESGLLILVRNCHQLESINVWAMRVPIDCFVGLVAISPSLQIKSRSVLDSTWV